MRHIAALIFLLFLPAISCADDDQYLFTELTKIAEDGNPEAQYHLGMLYNNGIGTVKDIAKAFYWFEKSASAGDPLGHYKVGCYYSGQGKGVIEISEAKALEHKLIAAKAGYVNAQYDIAATYYSYKDMSKAITWWKKAATQGDPDSVKILFALYSEGRGLPKDITKAYGYLKIIERNIGEENKSTIEPKVKELKSELSPTQLKDAEDFAINWIPQKTDLTIKAFMGKKESWRIVESSKNNINRPDHQR